MLDTLQAVKNLQDSGVEQRQAEAHVRLITQIENNQISTLATKQELKDVETKLSAQIDSVESKLSAQIDNVESKVDAKIGSVESKVDAMKWIIVTGLSIVGVLITLIGVLVTLVTYLHH